MHRENMLQGRSYTPRQIGYSLKTSSLAKISNKKIPNVELS